MTFVWDKYKNHLNIQNHHLSFELARHAFADPNRCEIYDEGNSTIDEHRYITIGFINHTPIFVSYVPLPNNVIRIISARKATRVEVAKFYINS